jgi:hypothetical protein
MWCAYTRDVEEILNFKTCKDFEKKVSCETSKEQISDVQPNATTVYNSLDLYSGGARFES